ncbi:hypothetical protein H4R18_003067 [Coemansia javaensis]|uniref:Uncharacterized protein n=1 Tax=Coemansia javaensis TaxID=2761396 RepID=A0A9W8HFU3_9FUNG|nr:hypothetical protein H4R18_003067 [Coemansia javaensis]
MEYAHHTPLSAMGGGGGGKSTDRHSMGLGIVLTNDSSETDFCPQTAAAAGPVAISMVASGQMGQAASSDFGASIPGTRRTSGTAVDKHSSSNSKSGASLVMRVLGGITAFMSTTDDGQSADTLHHKSRVEDMLESYYLSQGREVPSWVYDPPDDPPISAAARAPSPVLWSLARLNIGRLNRSQTTHAAREPQTSQQQQQQRQQQQDSRGTSVPPSETSVGARLRRMLPPQLAGRGGGADSGFSSPMQQRSSSGGGGGGNSSSNPALLSPVNVQMVDSGSSSLAEGEDDGDEEDGATSDSFAAHSPARFALDNDQLAAGARGGVALSPTPVGYCPSYPALPLSRVPERTRTRLLTPFTSAEPPTPEAIKRHSFWAKPIRWMSRSRTATQSPAVAVGTISAPLAVPPDRAAYGPPAAPEDLAAAAVMISESADDNSPAGSMTPRPGKVRRLLRRMAP